MGLYSIELKGIVKNANGTVDVNFTEQIDGQTVSDGGRTYANLTALDAEISSLSQQLLSVPMHLILAARAKSINAGYNNLSPLLGKKLSVDTDSVQVVRFQ